MKMERGFRAKLEDYLSPAQPVTVRISTEGNAVYDTCCFGVDASDKLSDDRYMVFYNQPVTPGNEIHYTAQGNQADYEVQLSMLPESIVKLVFTVSIDGSGTMGDIRSHRIELMQNGQTVLELALTGADFQNEKAIIGLEIYRKGIWRVAVVARGFDGGLDALLRSYGGEVEGEQTAEPAPVSAPAPAPQPDASVQRVNLEKKVTDKMMNKINLSKDKVNLEKHVVNLSKCVVDLSKKSGVDLGDLRARVVVVLDYSGSMGSLYRNGTVQSTLNRLVPLGLNFDDNGSIDLFLFQSDFRKMDDLDVSNYEDYVNQIIMTSDYRMGGTYYAPVLNAIIKGYQVPKTGLFGRGQSVAPIVDNSIPTFILFITDGENSDKPASDTIIRQSSSMNVFIQFVGIGTDSFRYLEKLDDLPGRARDNTGFVRMQDLTRVGDQELYTSVLEQFSGWLKGLQ